MNRRQALRLLGAALALGCLPAGGSWAASVDELAVKAQGLLAADKFREAIDILSRAALDEPRNERVQILLGRAWSRAGDPARALEHFRAALRLSPEDSHTRMLVASLTQRPPGPPVAPPGGSRSRLSALEKEAEEERRRAARGEFGPAGRRAAPRPARILLDPGHGGVDKGSIGPGGLREKDLTLDLALRSARVLAASGAVSGAGAGAGRGAVEVYLTRLGDVDLANWARTTLAEMYGVDLMVSIHAGAAPETSAGGPLLFSYASRPEGERAAAYAAVENAAAEAFGRLADGLGRDEPVAALFTAERLRLAHARGAAMALQLAEAMGRAPGGAAVPVGAGPFVALRDTVVPAVLVEAGNLGRAEDEERLGRPEFRQALAEALATALGQALGSAGRGSG